MPLSGPLLPRGARLFITGGTGFVGRSLLKFLNDPASGIQDVKVTLLTRNPERYAMRYPDLARGVELLRGDICDFAWPAATFSHVIHAAADTSSDAGNRPLELMQTIVDGTARVLDFAFSYKANKVLFLSSGAIYGRQPAALEQIPEEYSGELDPNEPASAYGNAKRLAEQLCTLATRSQAGRSRSRAMVRPFAPTSTRAIWPDGSWKSSSARSRAVPTMSGPTRRSASAIWRNLSPMWSHPVPKCA